MPNGGVPGQPKEWSFELADAGVLAQRLAAAVAQNTQGQSSATDDDIRYGQFGRDLRNMGDSPGSLPRDEEPFLA